MLPGVANMWTLFSVAFSALTLLVGHQEEHPACKHWVMRWGVGVVICLERGADCLHVVSLFHCIPKPHHLLSHLNMYWLLSCWYRLTQVVLEKRPLNGCSVFGCICEFCPSVCPRSAWTINTKVREIQSMAGPWHAWILGSEGQSSNPNPNFRVF